MHRCPRRLGSFFYLARSANLPEGLYILLALICFFFVFFNDRSESYYPRIYWTDFRNLFLGADDRSGLLFQYLKERCHGNQFCGKMANSPQLSLWHSKTVWAIATSTCALTAKAK